MRFFAALGLALLVLGGCKSGPTLEGTWNFTSSGANAAMPPGATGTATFTGNKVAYSFSVTDAQMGTLGLKLDGTFTLEKDQFTHQIENVVVDDSKVKPEVKALVAMAVKPDDIKKQNNEAGPMKVTWVSDKEVKLAGKSEVTLKR